jgi:hypothetical protein
MLPGSNEKPLILHRPGRKYKIFHRDILTFPYFFWASESGKIFGYYPGALAASSIAMKMHVIFTFSDHLPGLRG